MSQRSLSNAAREAISNVAKHAGVNEVRLIASGDGRGGVHVTVYDRGDGFAHDTQLGLGLARSVQDRIIEAGGNSEISSVPGRGTIVDMSWAP